MNIKALHTASFFLALCVACSGCSTYEPIYNNANDDVSPPSGVMEPVDYVDDSDAMLDPGIGVDLGVGVGGYWGREYGGNYDRAYERQDEMNREERDGGGYNENGRANGGEFRGGGMRGGFGGFRGGGGRR